MAKKPKAPQVKIYTDGACRGNPGPGGWGAVLTNSAQEKVLYGGEAQTTNNRMELMAAIRGLEALSRSCSVILVTDSKYLVNGITQWMPNWKRNGWRTASKLPVKNAELWRRLDDLVQKHTINWQWVKGHSGDIYNDRADALANRGIDELQNNG